MADSQAIQKVDRALDTLCMEFHEAPGLFFTEHDIASRAYHLVQKELDYQQVRGLDGEKHYLVHHEYPTPFRCDMHGTSFTVVDDEARAPSGGKYKRGHYDLVVLNPEFIQHCRFDLLNGQNYEVLKRELPSLMVKLREAPICYGIEFIYNRKPFSPIEGVHRWYAEIRQDLEKLEASRNWRNRPFMQSLIFMAFNRDTREEAERRIRRLFENHKNLVYCAPSQSSGH